MALRRSFVLKTKWMWFREKECAIVSPLRGFLYTIPILAPTAPAVGYDVSSLAGLAATHQTLAACASERKPRLLFARFLFHPRMDPRVQRPLVLSSHFLSLPNWGVALPNGLAVSPVLCPSGAQSGEGEGCICCARI